MTYTDEILVPVRSLRVGDMINDTDGVWQVVRRKRNYLDCKLVNTSLDQIAHPSKFILFKGADGIPHPGIEERLIIRAEVPPPRWVVKGKREGAPRFRFMGRNGLINLRVHAMVYTDRERALKACDVLNQDNPGWVFIVANF